MRGLVLGKFMPLHRGHLALIEFALMQCEQLTVLLCAEVDEPISGDQREQWLRETFLGHSRIRIQRLDYSDAELPATSVSSRAISELWTAKLREVVPETEMIIGSEAYVRYVAELWGIKHRIYDEERLAVTISATDIRENPYRYRAFLAPAARPHFVQKIVLHGTESTGKSTLVQDLAETYATTFVPETAREIVEHTDTVVYADLLRIADRQAEAIRAAIPQADGVLFIDTDVYTTLAYSRYLFGRELPLKPDWLAAAEHDLCLYTAADAPYVQDGTRLGIEERLLLDKFHRESRAESGIRTLEINGTGWRERTELAHRLCAQFLNGLVEASRPYPQGCKTPPPA